MRADSAFRLASAASRGDYRSGPVSGERPGPQVRFSLRHNRTEMRRYQRAFADASRAGLPVLNSESAVMAWKLTPQEKTKNSLDKKRKRIEAEIRAAGHRIDPALSVYDFVVELYRIGGSDKKPKNKVYSLHNHLLSARDIALGLRKPKAARQSKADRLKSDRAVNAFYASAEWRRARYDALKASAGRCNLCGRSAHDGIILNVDHIKPLRKFWELRCDLDNLQVLCGACNHGKGNRDQTDWRPKARYA